MESERVEDVIKTGLRSLATTCPITAPLAQAWNEYETNKKFLRIEELFQYLKDEFENSVVQTEYMKDAINKNSFEFSSLLEKTIEKIKREHSKEKRHIFARTLANFVVSNNSIPYNHKISIIETLDSLTEEDIYVLSVFKSPISNKKIVNVLDIEKSGLVPHISRTRRNQEGTEKIGLTITSLVKLESRGLISETEPCDYKENEKMGKMNHPKKWVNVWRKKCFEILPQGEILYKMVFEHGVFLGPHQPVSE